MDFSSVNTSATRSTITAQDSSILFGSGQLPHGPLLCPNADVHVAAAIEECPPPQRRGQVGGHDAIPALRPAATPSGAGGTAGSDKIASSHEDQRVRPTRSLHRTSILLGHMPSTSRTADFVFLAEQVKSLQKNSKVASRAWTAHCDNYNGIKDSYRHDLASLRLFLRLPGIEALVCIFAR